MDIQGEICSIADLTALVQESEDGLAQPGVGPPPIWYRGQADATWDVQPAVLRSDFVAAAERRAEAVNFKRGMKDQLMALRSTCNSQFRGLPSCQTEQPFMCLVFFEVPSSFTHMRKTASTFPPQTPAPYPPPRQ